MPAQSLPDQPAEPLAPREESSQGKKDDTLSAGPPAPRQRVTSNHPVASIGYNPLHGLPPACEKATP